MRPRLWFVACLVLMLLLSGCARTQKSVAYTSIHDGDTIPEGLSLYSGMYWEDPDGYVYQRIQISADQPQVVLKVVEDRAKQEMRVYIAPAGKERPVIWVRFRNTGLPVVVVI